MWTNENFVREKVQMNNKLSRYDPIPLCNKIYKSEAIIRQFLPVKQTHIVYFFNYGARFGKNMSYEYSFIKLNENGPE